MVVEHAKTDIVHDAVKIVRHHKAAGDFNIRTQDLEQRRGKHVVRVELAGVRKAVCGNFHGSLPRFYLFATSITHSAAGDNEKHSPGAADAVPGLKIIGCKLYSCFTRPA